ncbi:MAG: hypothetical protein ACXV7E_06900 [Methylobacter sp.]
MRKLSYAPFQQTSIFNLEKYMSIRERLNEKRKRLTLSQKKFGKFGRAKKSSQLNYEAGKGLPNNDYWKAAGATGADQHYILAGETKSDQLLAATKTSTEKIAGLALSDQCKAAVAQLLTGLHADNIEQIKDALEIIRADYLGLNHVNDDKKEIIEAVSDCDKCELTTSEKNLIAAYRKATQTDKSLMDRLAQLLEKVLEDEAESGIAENVIDGE